MTALALAIIPFALIVGLFFTTRTWLVKQPDQLLARHRCFGVLIWITAMLLLTTIILHYVRPTLLTTTGSLSFFMTFLLVFSIWQRQRLSRRLDKR